MSEIIHTVQDWLKHQTLLEIAGVVTGLLCVYLAARNNIWNWPFAIVSVGIYIFIFFDSRLFADMGLQFYFKAMNIYGWYNWSKRPAGEDKSPVLLITKREIIYSAIAIIVFTFNLGSLLKYTTASFPFLDSKRTTSSLVAQVKHTRKEKENRQKRKKDDIIY